MKTLEKTNKIFKISFTGGGEPFLIPNIVEACARITKKHYIFILTNLTINNKIKEFAQKINPKRVSEIHASLHIKELERHNLLGNYINNFLLCKEKGFKIIANVVAYPSLLNEVKKYKKFFRDKGINIKFEPFMGRYNDKEYPQSYTNEEKKIFDFDKINLKNTYNHQQKICNAGYNVGLVCTSGRIQPCNQISENIGHIYKKIKFKQNLTICPYKFCGCPLSIFDPYLFKKALKESRTTPKKPNNIFIIKRRLRSKMRDILILIKKVGI
jgi:MoaA/NifB/PqqE/SkfB family radical SAM enzyme